jgi:hypothetical protein
VRPLLTPRLAQALAEAAFGLEVIAQPPDIRLLQLAGARAQDHKRIRADETIGTFEPRLETHILRQQVLAEPTVREGAGSAAPSSTDCTDRTDCTGTIGSIGTVGTVCTGRPPAGGRRIEAHALHPQRIAFGGVPGELPRP